jgi:hypothetical protein
LTQNSLNVVIFHADTHHEIEALRLRVNELVQRFCDHGNHNFLLSINSGDYLQHPLPPNTKLHEPTTRDAIYSGSLKALDEVFPVSESLRNGRDFIPKGAIFDNNEKNCGNSLHGILFITYIYMRLFNDSYIRNSFQHMTLDKLEEKLLEICHSEIRATMTIPNAMWKFFNDLGLMPSTIPTNQPSHEVIG